jgi:hypothetical protein
MRFGRFMEVLGLIRLYDLTMVGDSAPQAVALEELVQWWEDLSRQQINSRAVLLAVPPRWGRTYLLNQFAALVEADETPSIGVPVRGALLPDGLGLQALRLKELFGDARVEHRVAEKLGMDRPGGLVQLGLGVGGLFVTQFPALVVLLVASVGAGTAQKAWDDSPAGEEGMVARLARAVATVSVSVPVVVTIDDADRLEPDLAVVLVENLIERINGRVLVVAAVNPGGKLMSALTSRSKYGLTEGRVRIVETDPGTGYQARVELAAGMCRNLPAAAIRRISQRTQNFAEVFTAASAKHLTELDAHVDDSTAIAAVDEVIDARVNRAPPSARAVVLAWAGGVLHTRQVERAVIVLNGGQSGDDGDVVRFESLVRLADPASSRIAEQVRVLASSERHKMADSVLGTAVEIGADPGAGLVEKVVAWQAAHRVRADLRDGLQLLSVQCQLVHGLENLGDPAAAYEVAHTALAERLDGQPDGQQRREREDLSAAVLRLAGTLKLTRNDPLIEATVAAAAEGGAAVGLEARIWAAIDLLGRPGQRKRALELTDELAAELGGRIDLGAVGNRWRLMLAFHAGRASYRTIAKQLLAPMLAASSPPEDGDAARAVLYAIDEPRADTRLQIIGFEMELAALPPAADNDRLRLHHALAASYAKLGDYRRALHHGQQELPLRHGIQGADSPGTLLTRNQIAVWTGECGDAPEALRLCVELLADQERVFGPRHLETLITRSNVALFTGECGDAQEARQLFWELLTDKEPVLGPSHPSVLMTRANHAAWTGYSGHPKEALVLFQKLLMDREHILGPDHPDTLITRSSIAAWTGECGDSRKALHLYQEVLADRERALGPDHPETLTTRNNIAQFTGECGDGLGALRLFRELLPDQERVLGPSRLETLRTRNNIAVWTGQCGDIEQALRMFRELLPDLERVLGPVHPETLGTRNNLAAYTGRCGDIQGALRLFQELLPDQQRVLGPGHPNTLITRRMIAEATAQCGNTRGALQLFRELLPDQQRVLGPGHPNTLTSRGKIAAFTGLCGDMQGALRLFQELLADQQRVLGPSHPETRLTQLAIQKLSAPGPLPNG